MQALCQTADLGSNVARKLSNAERQIGGERRCQLALESMKAYPAMTLEESKGYYHKIKAGDMEARNEFVVRNMRLAAKFARSLSTYNFDFDDLYSELSALLLDVVERWDINKGAFTTIFRVAVTNWVYDKQKEGTF